MRLGIDYVSLALFLVAFVISQIRTLSLKVRYLVVAASCGAIAAYRLKMGAQGVNLAFVGVAAVLAVMYLVRAFRSPR